MTRQRCLRAPIAMLAIALGGLAALGAQGKVIQGPDLEQFLKTARITTLKELPVGVTLPRKATLELNGVTRYGVYKTIDDKPAMGVATLEKGGVELEFQDSWHTEVAAYELAKLIGFDMVPATVERVVDGKHGSMQLWVDSVMDDGKRRKDKLQAPDADAFNRQVATLRLWDQLIYNTDRNEGNILITADWQLRVIDHSRTFRPFPHLQNPKLLTRFSRSILAKLGELNEPMLKQHLGPYLSSFQITGLVKRRDAIVALAGKLVAEKGEAAVLFD
jgi:hypothetical protein